MCACEHEQPDPPASNSLTYSYTDIPDPRQTCSFLGREVINDGSLCKILWLRGLLQPGQNVSNDDRRFNSLPTQPQQRSRDGAVAIVDLVVMNIFAMGGDK